MASINREGSKIITRLTEFRDMLGETYHGDQYMQSFRTGLRQELTNRDNYMLGVTLDALSINPAMAISHLETKILRATVHDSLDEPDFPANHNTPQAWRQSFERIFSDSDKAEAFGYNVAHRELQSNVSERYKGLYAFMALAQRMGRLTTGSVVDIGCSQNLGLKRLAGGYGFGLPTAESPTDAKIFGHLLDTTVTLGPSQGIDHQALSAGLEWTRACSFNPIELLDRQKVRLFDELVASTPRNVSFLQGDFAEPAEIERLEDEGLIQNADVFHWSTVKYMLKPAQRLAMIRHAKRFNPQFLVVQDFANVYPTNPRHIRYRSNWQEDPMPYRTMVMDMAEPSPQWHELFLWQNGRATHIALGTGAMALGQHGPIPARTVIEDLVHAAYSP